MNNLQDFSEFKLNNMNEAKYNYKFTGPGKDMGTEANQIAKFVKKFTEESKFTFKKEKYYVKEITGVINMSRKIGFEDREGESFNDLIITMNNGDTLFLKTNYTTKTADWVMKVFSRNKEYEINTKKFWDIWGEGASLQIKEMLLCYKGVFTDTGTYSEKNMYKSIKDI